METVDTSNNIVHPVPPGTKRPLWSVMIPTFNPGRYFIDAVNSAVSQNISSDLMQIEVVDDCSTKVDIPKIIEANWQGRVDYYRLPRNVGHSFNFTESLRRAKGELIHLLHDDDLVKPGFYSAMENIFAKYENIGAAFCRQEYIDENGLLKFYSELEMPEEGILDDALIKLAQKQRIQYCAMVVKRKVFEDIGGFVTKNIGCEDWEMWVRIAAHYPVAYEPQALAQYRVHHGTSMTLKDMRSGQDMRFMREAIGIFNEYLPKEKRAEVNLFRRRYYGAYSFKNAERLFNEFKDKEGAAAQLSETIKIDSELIFDNINFLKSLETPIESAGVSVVICTNNNEDTIERTLRHLIIQRVSKYIPWEILLVDNASSDNTVKKAEETWKKYNGKTPFKIIDNKSKDLVEQRDTAMKNAKYNFVLFCNPGDLLNRNYVEMVSVNMMRDLNLGVLGAYTEPVIKTDTPDWFDAWSNYCYQIGEQYEYTSDITWSRGFVWGSGMAVRKEAWEALAGRHFRSVFEGSSEKVTQHGIDNELCYALRISGWTIWYSIDLRLRHILSEKDLIWKKLRNIWRQNGINKIVLEPFTEFKEHNTEDFNKLPGRKNRRKQIELIYRRLKGIDRWKLRSYNENLTGDNDILIIEYRFAKLRELLLQIKPYNKKLRLLKRIVRKKDFKFLKYVVTHPYFRFPQYKNPNDKRGISVILNYTDSSYNLLLKSLDKISNQKIPEHFPWEVILVSNFIEADVRAEIYRMWERSNCGASLKIVEEKSITSESIRDLALSKSRFDYFIFLSEYDLLHRDYARLAYKAINKNKSAGIIGGQTELASDVKPPKWFGKYNELFGIGKQSEESGDITFSRGYIWNTGIVARRKALQEIKDKHFDFTSIENNNIHSEIPYDINLSNEIKLAGWKIFYEERLKSGRFVTVKHFNWEYLRKVYYAKGAEEIRETAYAKLFDGGIVDPNEKSWLTRANKTLLELNKHPYKKIFSKETDFKNDTEVLEIERLQGKFKELIKSKDKYNKFSAELKSRLNGNGIKKLQISQDSSGRNEKKKGVSVVICCYNSSEVLPETLKHIFTQKVPDEIPWEVIIVDNASTDNTSVIAQKIHDDFNCLSPFKIVKEPEPGLSAARRKGFDTAKYEYIVLCDDDNWLDKNFVKNVYDIMSGNNEIGILGGQSRAEFDIIEPKWFDAWKNSFAIGKQSETPGDITYSRGYVWGAAMVVRKEAWEKLQSGGFKSLLTDRKGNTLSSGGDTEICYALRNEGWKIWYDPKLKFKHFISSKRLNWKYLRKLFRGFGQASPGLDHYLINNKEKSNSENLPVISKSARTELYKTLSILRKTRYNKLLTYDAARIGDTDIPMIEYCLGRIEGLLKTRLTYNRGIKLLKRTARKNDHKYLKSIFKNYNPDFPKYKTVKKLNGVSVIICTYNGEERLADTIRHIAKQKTNPALLWELILVDNASTDQTKQVSITEWKKHNPKAKLKIVDEFTQGLSAARQKGFDTAQYEYIVLCDDDNWLDENFVQTTYDIMSGNEKIGILGGPNEALCELEPPEWFKWFQHGYAAGVQTDFSTGKVTEGNITWKRGFVWGAGMIIRRTALKELYAKGFHSLMSDRKGNQLSSGGDSELCFALVLSGWQVWYDTRLKLKHCMPAGRVSWNYLIRLFEGFGITSVGLDYYEKAIKYGSDAVSAEEATKQNWKYEYKKTYKAVNKYGLKKILSLRFPQDNNTEIPMLEFHLARLKELKRVKKEYDKNIEAIRNAKWKADDKVLKAGRRKFIETENDFRYGWPWIDTPVTNTIELKSYPKISILSPSFNSENTIEKAILSVLNQGYPDFEHIIYDGGSKDGTVEILKKYPHLKWVSEPDKGQCDAMNKAFSASTGEIISYLNVDDYYQRGAFIKIAKAFEEDPSSEMVVGNLYFECDDHTFIRKPEIEYRKIMLPFKYLFPINPVSYFYKRNVQTEAGPFPLDNNFTMDYWFLLKAYQKHKLMKIEDYLGTFWMNGFNKTSGADNRKNTHYRVLEHCRKFDRKNLPYYLFNYYKYFYYDIKPYNLGKIFFKLKRNFRRFYSLLFLKKNKYYSQRLFDTSRTDYYLNKRFKSTSKLAASFLIYPKGLFQRSRQSLFVHTMLGKNKTEKAKLAYFFFTTPPGLPLANKLHYYGKEFRINKKRMKGNTLLFLTFLVSPRFFMKHKNYSSDSSSGSKNKVSFSKILHYLNPLTYVKGFINFFRYKRYREISYNYFIKAGEKYYFHKNFQATILMFLSFLVYPASLRKKSRLNMFIYSAFGSTLTEKLMVGFHLYKDNPEYTFAHKLNYYGNELKRESKFKGRAILFSSYVLSPKYFFKREKKKSNVVFVSNVIDLKSSTSFSPARLASNSIYRLKQLKSQSGNFGTYMRNSKEKLGYTFRRGYHYFKYRKYKAKSKLLYAQAIENYNSGKKLKTVMLLVPSYLLYPVSVFNRNKMSLMINSMIPLKGKTKQKK